MRKEVKDDTAKYEETITELKQKGQIRKFRQISYWSTLKPNTLRGEISSWIHLRESFFLTFRELGTGGFFARIHFHES